MNGGLVTPGPSSGVDISDEFRRISAVGSFARGQKIQSSFGLQCLWISQTNLDVSRRGLLKDKKIQSSFVLQCLWKLEGYSQPGASARPTVQNSFSDEVRKKGRAARFQRSGGGGGPVVQQVSCLGSPHLNNIAGWSQFPRPGFPVSRPSRTTLFSPSSGHCRPSLPSLPSSLESFVRPCARTHSPHHARTPMERSENVGPLGSPHRHRG